MLNISKIEFEFNNKVITETMKKNLTELNYATVGQNRYLKIHKIAREIFFKKNTMIISIEDNNLSFPNDKLSFDIFKKLQIKQAPDKVNIFLNINNLKKINRDKFVKQKFRWIYPPTLQLNVLKLGTSGNCIRLTEFCFNNFNELENKLLDIFT